MKKRFLALLGTILLIAVVAIELLSRTLLGLGDPPLSIAHPTIEYMFKPSSEYQRFGNVFKTNSFGMRSEDFTQYRQSNEVRILVLGDSIPNGGNLTDQSELATELLKQELEGFLQVPVVVGNISAGTWSPPNLLAYLHEYGTFDADAAIIILNNGDIFDFPTFEKLNPKTHPTQKPKLAMVELLNRYLIPKVSSLFDTSGGVHTNDEAKSTEKENCLSEIQEIQVLLSEKEIPTFFVYHPSKSEMAQSGTFTPGEGAVLLKEFMEQQNTTLYTFADIYADGIVRGLEPYRDRLHPNAMGQRLISEYMLGLLEGKGFIKKWSDRDRSEISPSTP